MLDLRSLPIDPDRVQARIDQLGAIGVHPNGGLFRTLYDDGWVEAMALLRRWMEEAGLSVRFDAVGNLWGRAEGTGRGPGYANAVVTGSHVDTVRQGGKYDGALGVHMAIAAVQALLEGVGRPKRPLEVLVTCEEEGSRFACSFWGARAIVGRVGADEPDRIADPDGVTIGAAMRERGFDPARIGEAERHDLAAFVEAHIEQGAILEREGYPLGVVTSITGQRWIQVTVDGIQNHAGTTPMDLRQDALAGAATMIARIEAAALAMGRPAVATVGRIQALPGGTNIIPGRCTFTVDSRHAEFGPRQQLLAEIEKIIRETARERGLDVTIQTVMDHDPVPMSQEIRAQIEASIQSLGLQYLVMPSGAGHDSEILAPRVPTAMLFVPSKGGKSHTPEELTPVEWVVPGIQALAGALHRLAYA
ncbi:MAG: Zn-dependent hydrolase [Chloroflexota bacterium]